MSNATRIGNIAEMYMLDFLKKCPNVITSWKCNYNSKYDLFYKLKDGHMRGLQVKHMGYKKRRTKNPSFRINHLDKYRNGDIIVCLSCDYNVGLIFIMTEYYSRQSASITLNCTKGIFSRMTTSLDEMKRNLLKLLELSPIITDLSSIMTPDQLKEKESTERFLEFCKKHGYNPSFVVDNSSVTDLIINGCKIQMKFASNPENRQRTYSYKITLGHGKNNNPYKYGDNDYYVVELGTHKNKFLIIPERELLERGYLTTDTIKGRKNLNVFPYDHVETRSKITVPMHRHRVKGNWTCNKNLWYNSDKKPFFEIEKRHPYNKIGDGPEGAEIRIIAEYLNKVWSNKLIVALGWDEKSKFHKTGVKGIDLVKVPCRVVGVFSRGKVIVIECVNSSNQTIYMVSQLGMEGRWIHTKDKHSNFRIYFGGLNPEKTKYIITDKWYYDDSRHFGHFNVYSDLSEIKKRHGPCFLTTALVNIGCIKTGDLRPYQELVTLENFKSKIRYGRIRTKQICDFLMEQKYFSGIGNYLRAEIMYRAKINPIKPLGSFSDEDITLLFNTILQQMLIAYGARGLTIKSYWDPEGNAGKCPLQVYNQTTDPLGNEVEKFKDKSKRMVHWVPVIQVN